MDSAAAMPSRAIGRRCEDRAVSPLFSFTPKPCPVQREHTISLRDTLITCDSARRRRVHTWLWHHTTLEDEYIITRNAAGVNSRFFEPGPYHPEFEFTLQQFVHWYLHSLEASLH